MPRHANLPFHLYVNIDNAALGQNMPAGVTKGLWHAAYCRPGQIMQAHVMLESGAHWCGIHLHQMSVATTFRSEADELMPWGGMGEHLEIVHLPYLEGLTAMGVAHTALGTVRDGFCGRHTGLVFDWSDGFSRYPQEHKPLNLIKLDHGQFALYPNNWVQYIDKHFTSVLRQDNMQHYRRGETVIWET